MVNKLVEQYARFLDEDYVVSLFEKLEKKFGNLQESQKNAISHAEPYTIGKL